MKKLFMILLCAMFFVGNAQDPIPGTFDETYGTNGIAYVSPSTNFDFISAMLLQQDGKIVVVGRSRQDGSNYSVFLSRQNADGSLDETFADNGFAFFRPDPIIYLNEGRDAVMSPEGNIYVAGHMFDATLSINKAFILCVDMNGFINPYFGEDGIVYTENGHNIVFESVDIDTEGRIIAAGYRDDKIFVVRFTAEGAFDSTFGTDGCVIVDNGYYLSNAWSVKCLEDGDILVAASYLHTMSDPFSGALYKFDTNGNLVSSFGNAGVVDFAVGSGNEYPLGIDVQNDGNYIVAGHSWLSSVPYLRYECFVTAVTPNGTIDTSFGDAGMVKMEPLENAKHSCYGVTVAEDGQIFGTFYGYNYTTSDNAGYVFNLDANGNLKENFADNGLYTFQFTNPEVQTSEVLIQEDGKLVVGGYVYDGNVNTDIFLARFHTDIVNDVVFDIDEIDNLRVYPNPASSTLYVTSEVCGSAYVEIIDLTGRCVKQIELSDISNTSIDISDIKSGVYFVKVQQDDNQSVQRIVVK